MGWACRDQQERELFTSTCCVRVRAPATSERIDVLGVMMMQGKRRRKTGHPLIVVRHLALGRTPGSRYTTPQPPVARASNQHRTIWSEEHQSQHVQEITIQSVPHPHPTLSYICMALCCVELSFIGQRHPPRTHNASVSCLDTAERPRPSRSARRRGVMRRGSTGVQLGVIVGLHSES